MPAEFIHDTGWYGQDPAAWKKFVDAVKSEYSNSNGILRSEKICRPHQNKSLLIGGIILERAGYFDRNPAEYWLEIADIVGDHDTRSLPTTDSGRIVRAGDHLWRVSFPAMEIYFPDLPLEQALIRMKEDTFQEPPFTLEGIESDVGRLELANTLVFKFGKDKAAKVLKERGYEKELERIVAFYK